MWERSYCRVPSQQTERDSILGVKKQFALLGMEASSPVVISENLSIERNPRDRSICFQIISSDQYLFFVEARSIELSRRCLPTKLVPQESSCFSPILHDPESSYDDPCNSSLAIATVVPRSNENDHTATNFIDLRKRSLKNWKGEIHRLVQNKPLKLVAWTVSGLDCKRKEFQGRLPTLSFNQENQVQPQFMNLPGIIKLAGVLKEKLIYFVVI